MDLDYTYHFKEDQFLSDYDQVSLFLDKNNFQEGHTGPSTATLNSSSPSVSVFSIQDFPGEAFEVGLAQAPQQHSAPQTTISIPMTLEAELEVCSLRSSPRDGKQSQRINQEEQAIVFEVISSLPQPAPAEPAQDLPKLCTSSSSLESLLSPLSDRNFASPSPSYASDSSTNTSPKTSPRRALDSPKEKKEHSKKKPKLDRNTEKQEIKEKEDKDHGKNHVKLQRGGKNRLKWTPELMELFHKAVKKLGSGAVPSAILEEMNVKGLSRENVASHLQKYRLQNKKVSRRGSPDDILYPEEKEQMKNMVALDYMGHAMHPQHGVHPGHPFAFHHPEASYMHPMHHMGPHHPPPRHSGMYHGAPMPHHLQRRFSVPTHMMGHPPSHGGPHGAPHSPPPSHHSLPPSPLPQPQSPPPSQPGQGQQSPHHHHNYVCYNCTRRFSLPGGHFDDMRAGYPAHSPAPGMQFDS